MTPPDCPSSIKAPVNNAYVTAESAGAQPLIANALQSATVSF